MILRYWRGWTTEENADLYDEIVREVLAGIAAREVAGYRGAYLARRELGDETEFQPSCSSIRPSRCVPLRGMTTRSLMCPGRPARC